MLKKGVASISFRKYSCFEIIMAAKKAEINAIEWGSDIHAPCDDVAKLNKIAALQKENNIVCSSYGTYFKIGVNNPQEIADYIAAAKILGTNVLRIWCGVKSSTLYTKSEKQMLFKDALRLADIAQEENIILCLEFHPDTFTDCSYSSFELMKAVNSPNLKMYWQPNQFKSLDENLLEAKAVSKYVQNIHVFNWDKNNNRYPLGGAVNVWRQYAACFKGEHCMLLEFMPDDKIESLKNESIALNKIIV